MIDYQEKSGLTNSTMAAILAPVAHIGGTGLDLSGIHGAGRPQSGFFMRKISALHIMSGWAGTRKSGRVVCPVGQPVQSGSMIDLMLSGLNPFTHESQL